MTEVKMSIQQKNKKMTEKYTLNIQLSFILYTQLIPIL